jgi:hypothetical protein
MWPGSGSAQGRLPRWQRPDGRPGGMPGGVEAGMIATATRLVVGGCDLVTAPGGALAVAIVEAVLVELPLAALSLYIGSACPVVTAQGPDDRSRRRVTRSQP